jgi:hypothetical protein
MIQFTTKYADSLRGMLCGFDRLIFHGTLRTLSSASGMRGYLSYRDVLLKDFGRHAQWATSKIKRAVTSPFRKEERPMPYLPSAHTSKEELAKRIAQADGVTCGRVCLISALEMCLAFDVNSSRDGQRLQVVARQRKCLHLYSYQIHPVFGWIHARIQTWFPFAVQIYVNGREWLARQMQAVGMAYQRKDNCICWVEDFAAAQALLDAQLTTDWSWHLNEIATGLNPVLDEILAPFVARYYWTCHESEWATDLVFSDDSLLRRLYPRFVQHGMTALSSPDVLRFLGRPVSATGQVHHTFLGEVVTDMKRRQEGVRIKHRVGHNSIKAYDKAYTQLGSVLRIETTVNDPTDFKVYRPAEGNNKDLAWRPLRRGVADIYRRSQVCQKANERYLDALASADTSQTVEQVVGSLAAPTTWKGKRVRGLNPYEPGDAVLLEAISRGEFVLNGLRNRDLQNLLFPTQAGSTQEVRKRSSQVTRKLRMLRAHGLLAKVSHTHRYQVTEKGRRILTALLTVRQTPVEQLLRLAA